MLKYFSVLFSLFLLSAPLQAQHGFFSRIGRDVKHFAGTGLDLAAAPLTYEREEWLLAGGVVATTALLFTVDKEARRYAQDLDKNKLDKYFFIDSYMGNQYSMFLGAGIYSYGLLSGNDRVRHRGLMAMEAFIYSGAITGVFKVLISRRRPFAGESQLHFRPVKWLDNTYHSLPSGHTTVSFAVSTVLADAVDNGLWKTFWYGAAAWVGASRIYHNQHWLSDVFLGGVIGYATGRFIVNRDRRRTYSRLKMQPWFGRYASGVQLIWQVN